MMFNYQQVRWVHWKVGGEYRILNFAIEESTLTPLVIYEKIGGGIWSRPCTEFFDGRFKMVDDSTKFTEDNTI